MRRRRLIIAVVLLLLLAGVMAALWTALDWPPPRLILKYGLPPVGGPTGRSWTNTLGFEFVEIAPGYRKVEWHVLLDEGDWLGRISAPIGLHVGRWPREEPWSIDMWVEVDTHYWISTRAVDYGSVRSGPGGILLEPESPYENWVSAHDGRRYRAPSESELLLAAAMGVWPEWALLHGEQGNVILLGTYWQRFRGSKLRYLKTAIQYQADTAARSAGVVPWRQPPLIWIPLQEPD